MKLVWIFVAFLASLCFDLGSASVSFKLELNKKEFLEFKIKYNKIYKNEVEEKFRMLIFIENKASDNSDHIHADKLSHELESDVESLSDIEEFETFKKTFNKKYETEDEHTIRQKIFKERKKRINKHNARFSKGLETYEMGVNQFTDMSKSELQSLQGLKRKKVSKNSSSYNEFLPPMNEELPTEVDWRENRTITAVKHQGDCDSGWAFAATGALEAHNFLKNEVLIPLSEQNLVDCVTENDDYFGCDGGTIAGAFGYIRDNGGINPEKSYPFEEMGGDCRFSGNNVVATMSGFEEITSGSEEDLKTAVAIYGPVAVSINSDCESFKSYSGGVLYDETCDKDNLNHAVLVIGYGTDLDEGDYWLIKNSYDTTWGEEGFGKMARNKQNFIGIGKYGAYPLV